jgi:hypothetical protein
MRKLLLLLLLYTGMVGFLVTRVDIMTESAYNKHCIPLSPYKTYLLLKAFCQT